VAGGGTETEGDGGKKRVGMTRLSRTANGVGTKRHKEKTCHNGYQGSAKKVTGWKKNFVYYGTRVWVGGKGGGRSNVKGMGWGGTLMGLGSRPIWTSPTFETTTGTS